jgi:hypothetical protein
MLNISLQKLKYCILPEFGSSSPKIRRFCVWNGQQIMLISWNILHESLLSIYIRFNSSLLHLGRFFISLILYTVGRTPWTGDQPVARPLPTHRIAQTQNKRTQTSISWVGFEPTIPAFERAKTIHALDRAATVVGMQESLLQKVGNSYKHCVNCKVTFCCKEWIIILWINWKYFARFHEIIFHFKETLSSGMWRHVVS